MKIIDQIVQFFWRVTGARAAINLIYDLKAAGARQEDSLNGVQLTIRTAEEHLVTAYEGFSAANQRLLAGQDELLRAQMKLVERFPEMEARYEAANLTLQQIGKNLPELGQRIETLEHQLFERERRAETAFARYEQETLTLRQSIERVLAEVSSSVETAGAQHEKQILTLRQSIERVLAEVSSFRGIYLGRDRVLVRCRDLPIALIAESNDRIVVPSLILNGAYEPEVISFIMRNVSHDSFCVDVGANIGYHTCVMGSLARDGQVFSFEPDPDTFQLLRENININWLEATVHPVCHAVLDHSGTAQLNRIRNRSVNTTIAQQSPELLAASGQEPGGAVTVPCRTLDDALNGVERVDFLKIDVEGAEMLVLQGARGIIAANPQLKIMMEWSPHQLEQAGFSAAKLLEEIRTQGLSIARLRLDGVPDPASDEQMLSSPYWNVILSRALL